MSTTMTMTAVTSLPPSIDMSTSTSPSCCPNCHAPLALPSPDETQSTLLAAQAQITDLQSQILLLNQKASAAVDRLADYEDELTSLRSLLSANTQRESSSSTTTSAVSSAPTTAHSSFNRLSALLSPARKPLPASPMRQEQPGETEDLLTALSRERFLRREAEGRLSETESQVEDLTASLFGQANEMVASERRARAELESRVEVLERRDREKRGRLERLEAAVGRIERVRRVLGENERVMVEEKGRM